MATRSDVMRLTIDVQGREAERRLDRFAGKAQATAKKSEGSFQRMTRSLDSFRNALYLGGAGALAVGGINALDRLAKRAAQIENLSTAFRTLTARVGESSDAMLMGMRRAADGLVSNSELMRQANNALLLGLPVTAESMEELTEASITLGRAMGLDATRALESMITGIGRQSRLMLDNLGIVVDATAAYENFADKIGVSTSELTDAQKKLAFYEETVRIAKESTEGLATETLRAADAWTQARVAITNLTENVLSDFNRQATEALTIWRSIAVVIPTVLENMGPLGRAVSAAGGVIAGGAGAPAAPAGAPSQMERLGALPGVGTPEDIQNTNKAIAESQKRVEALADELLELQTARLGGGLISAILGTTVGPEEQPENVFRQKIDPLSLVVQDTYDAVLESAEFGEAEYTRIQEEAAKRRQQINQMEAEQRLQTMLWVTTQIGQSLAILFENNKIAAIANAIVNTAEGVTAALKLGPAGIPLAAIIAAAGAKQIATIRRTTLQSAGGVGGVGVGGGAGAGSSGAVTPSTVGPTRNVEIRIFIEGQGFIQDSESFARDIGDRVGRQFGRAGLTPGGGRL